MVAATKTVTGVIAKAVLLVSERSDSRTPQSGAMKDAERATEPLFVANPENEHDMSLLKEYFGLHALQHAFGPEGAGMDELEYNICIANLLQVMREDKICVKKTQDLAK